MKFGIAFANVGPFVQPDEAAFLAKTAEEAGFESLWTVEHVVVPKGYESAYPYSENGKMPGPEESPIPEKVSDLDPGTYSLQVASFQDQREATIMVSRLKRAGHKSFLVSVNMPERGGQWYRVRVGPFQTKKNVWSYKKIFEKKEKLATFVVKLRSEV